MYIAHVSTSITLTQTVLNQMLYQKESGHRVVALCTNDEWSLPLKEKEIEVIEVPLLRHNPFASMIALIMIFILCRREKFDVVHTHTLLPGIVGRLAARLAGIPAVVHTFHTWPPHLWSSKYFIFAFNWTERLSSYAGHAMLFQNRDDMQCWLKIKGIPKKKAVLVGNGIDFAGITGQVSEKARCKIRQEFGIPDDTFVLVKVARFEAQKGHPFFLEILEELSTQLDDKFMVFLVGIGKEQTNIEHQAEQLGLEKSVIFTGYRSDVPDLLKASDVSVLTSHFEGIPRALMESMALGLPVVATDVPGSRELVIHGENGFLLPYGEVDTWVKVLNDLSLRPQVRKELGIQGRKRVMEFFDEYTVADRVEEVYRHFLTNNKGVPPSWDIPTNSYQPNQVLN